MPEILFVDYSDTQPKFQRPELLLTPPIPVPLHGVAPRVIKGQVWWDVTRRHAYDQNNGCCWACGIYSSEDPIKPALEAHEAYDFDYDLHTITLREVVAMCHSCHSYVHPGYLVSRYKRGRITREQIRTIFTSRNRILRRYNMSPYRRTRVLQLTLFYHNSTVADWQARMEGATELPPLLLEYQNWEEWRLVLEGKEYDAFGDRSF